MIKSPSPERIKIEGSIIHDVRNLFRLKRELDDTCIDNNCIDYKSNGNRNEAPSIEEYFNKIRLYLKDILNGLKNLIHGKLS